MRVSASGLGHRFPGTGMLFTDLDFEFGAGDLVALRGPSGSGKSTLLSLLAGWERPAEGQIAWEGIDSVGWVFQNPYGIPRRTALDHVAQPLIAQGHRRSQADSQARAILQRFDLESAAERPFKALSGGEAQRLMLARAVAKAPSLLLVDEPTAQLDPIASRAVNTVLAQLAMADAIVVVATHDRETAAACGTIIELGVHAAR